MSPDLASRLRESSVAVSAGGRGRGSGVIWSANGLIVTNAHVVRSRNPVVILADGRPFDAAIVKLDRQRDLALLSIRAAPLTPVELADSSRLRVGDLVAAVGNPFGITGALSTGIIHATDQPQWVQADVRLAPGNSGGILADARGRLIGLNTMIYAGIALAVPSNAIVDFVRRNRGAMAA